jgi:shikimate dehydrogenase
MVYLAFDVRPADLERAIEGLRVMGARGANLTVPHKEPAMGMIDHADPVAAKIGAVNTLVNDEGVLHGYNTDVLGFSAALGAVRGAEGAQGLRCLVVGAGGAARAVVAALVDGDAAHVWVCNRTYRRALELCNTASSWGATPCEAGGLDRADEYARDADLVVNATTLGMTLSVKSFPVGVDTLHSGHIVVDLVYGTSPTSLVEAARARGARAVDGKEMLVMQAAGSYRLWTGREPPVDVMRAIADRCER